MGDYDDGRELGLWGADGIPDWSDDDSYQKIEKKRKTVEPDMNSKKYNTVECDSKYVCLKVMLTPSSLLNARERYTRSDLYKEQDTEIKLELIHDKGNEADSKALEVYYDQIFMGHIRKKFKDADINNTNVVNDFCFEDNKLRDISLFWNGEEFYLRKKTERTLHYEYKQKRRETLEELYREIEQEKEKKKQKKEQQKQDKIDKDIEEEKEKRLSFYKALLKEWKRPSSHSRVYKNEYMFYGVPFVPWDTYGGVIEYYDNRYRGATNCLKNLRKPSTIEWVISLFNKGKYTSPVLRYWKKVATSLEYNIDYLEEQLYGEYDKDELRGPDGRTKQQRIAYEQELKKQKEAEEERLKEQKEAAEERLKKEAEKRGISVEKLIKRKKLKNKVQRFFVKLSVPLIIMIDIIVMILVANNAMNVVWVYVFLVVITVVIFHTQVNWMHRLNLEVLEIPSHPNKVLSRTGNMKRLPFSTPCRPIDE